LGGAGDTVNVAGTLAYVNVTNVEVSDKTILINKGGAAASAGSAGITVEENAAITGNIQISADRSSWQFKAPANLGIVKITPSSGEYTASISANSLTANRVFLLPDATGTLALTSDVSSAVSLASYADRIARQSDNLIKNGNSEDPNPTGFEAQGIVDGTGLGGVSKKIRRLDSGGSGLYFTDHVPCTPGEKFLFSLWIWNADVVSAAANLYCIFWRADGSVATDGIKGNSTGALPGGAYVQRSVDGTAPTDAAFVQFHINADAGNGWFRIDGLYAVRKVSAGMIAATGTRDATTYLRGDGVWAPVTASLPSVGSFAGIKVTGVAPAAGANACWLDAYGGGRIVVTGANSSSYGTFGIDQYSSDLSLGRRVLGISADGVCYFGGPVQAAGAFNSGLTGASVVTSRLTTGVSSEAFRLITANGSGTSENTEQAWFGLAFNDTRAGGISFVRGSDSKLDSLVFTTNFNNTAMRLDYLGNATITGGVTATSFTGSGAGLTGYAPNLTVGDTRLTSSSGVYVWSLATAAASYGTGVSLSFVRSTEGWDSYGTVVNIKSNPNGAGSMQMYIPYDPDYGGSSLKYRLCRYNSDNPIWCSFKTLIDSENIASQSVASAAQLSGGNYSNAIYWNNYYTTISSSSGWIALGNANGPGDTTHFHLYTSCADFYMGSPLMVNGSIQSTGILTAAAVETTSKGTSGGIILRNPSGARFRLSVNASNQLQLDAI
jgi:hypothetical protein